MGNVHFWRVTIRRYGWCTGEYFDSFLCKDVRDAPRLFSSYGLLTVELYSKGFQASSLFARDLVGIICKKQENNPHAVFLKTRMRFW